MQLFTEVAASIQSVADVVHSELKTTSQLEILVHSTNLHIKYKILISDS